MMLPAASFLLVLVRANEIAGKDAEDLSAQNFEMLFGTAKEAYLSNDWKTCARSMEKAIRDYRFYQDHVTRCKMTCRAEVKDSFRSEFLNEDEEEIEDLRFFEKAIKNTLCVMKCKREAFGPERVEQVSVDTLKEFETKSPYNYLQLCYYQLKEYQKAASAAYTFLMYNSDNEIMENNLKYYLAAGADKMSLKNFEAHHFVMFFLSGTDSYREHSWSEVVDRMEKALKFYLEAEEECRFACEKPFDMGWFPDFIISISNHFTFCLRCKRACPTSLSNLNGEYIEDLVPLIYHYLQIAYYKMGDVKKACEAVASYFLFRPEDEEMIRNKNIYTSDEGAEDSWFQPRPEAIAYHRRQAYEKKLLEFIETKFTLEDKEPRHIIIQRFDKLQPDSREKPKLHPSSPTPPPRAKVEL